MRRVWHTAVIKAIQSGDIIPPSACEICAKKKPLDAHHHKGYSEEHWLDVQWLCRACHRKIHPGDVERLRAGQAKGLATRMSKYTDEERSAIMRKAWETRRLRYTPEELAAQAEASARKRRGAKRSDEARARMSAAHKGKTPWNKGRKNNES